MKPKQEKLILDFNYRLKQNAVFSNELVEEAIAVLKNVLGNEDQTSQFLKSDVFKFYSKSSYKQTQFENPEYNDKEIKNLLVDEWSNLSDEKKQKWEISLKKEQNKKQLKREEKCKKTEQNDQDSIDTTSNNTSSNVKGTGDKIISKTVGKVVVSAEVANTKEKAHSNQNKVPKTK